MEKLLTEIFDISDNTFSFNENVASPFVSVSLNRSQKKTLTECVKYLTKVNDVEKDLMCSFAFNNIVLNDELSNKKVRYLAYELACAIDSNSVEKVKALKKEYGNNKEFLTAKKFLDKNCKDIWNVFESKNKLLKIPKEAMKALGISNVPSLDVILGNSVRYYEKDGGDSTAVIISNILKNNNLNYSMDDIHSYLKTVSKKEQLSFNPKTVEYLISKQSYDKNKLLELNIEKSVMNNAYESLIIFDRLKYIYRNICKKLLI